MRRLLLIVVVAVVLVAARFSIFTVDAAEYAFVTVLGRHTATYDGGNGETGAGLHVGWPWPIQSVQRIDRRLQFFDLRPKEELTSSGKAVGENLTVQAFVTWKVAGSDGVDRFVRTVGAMDLARTLLQTNIEGRLGALIQQMPLSDFVSTEAGSQPGRTHVDEAIDSLQTRLIVGLKAQVLDQYGIELVDIRLRRFNHPEKVRPSIFERIRSERARKVAEYESEGKFLARKIESAADQAVAEKLAKARAEEEKLKGQADAEAMRIRSEAQRQDPEFYAFLKKMEKLQSILGDKESRSVLLLSTHRALFDLLFTPPRPERDMKAVPDAKDKKANSGGG